MIYKCDSIVLFNNKKINYLIRQQYKVFNFFLIIIFYIFIILLIDKFEDKYDINVSVSNKDLYEI